MSALCGFARVTDFQRAHRQWVEQALLHDARKRDAHHWLILHGRYTCIARKPKCAGCIISDLCEFKGKTRDQ